MRQSGHLARKKLPPRRNTLCYFCFWRLWACARPLTIARQDAAGTEPLRLEESLDAMGTTYSLVIYGTDRYKMMAAAEAAFEEVRRLDRMLSNYRPDSDLSEINRKAAEVR